MLFTSYMFIDFASSLQFCTMVVKFWVFHDIYIICISGSFFSPCVWLFCLDLFRLMVGLLVSLQRQQNPHGGELDNKVIEAEASNTICI